MDSSSGLLKDDMKSLYPYILQPPNSATFTLWTCKNNFTLKKKSNSTILLFGQIKHLFEIQAFADAATAHILINFEKVLYCYY